MTSHGRGPDMPPNMPRRLATILATTLLAGALGACSGTTTTTASTSSTSAGTTVNASEAKAADAVPTPYDIDDVDAEVREHGKQVINTLNDLMNYMRDYYAADEDDRTDMENEARSLRSAYDDAAAELGQSDDSWDLATHQYYTDVVCYVAQLQLAANELSSGDASADDVTPLSSSVDGSVPTPYDTDDVDSEVREHGEGLIEATNEAIDFLQGYYAADTDERSDMQDEYNDAEENLSDAIDQFGSSDDSWDLATRQYYLDVECYFNQMSLESSQLREQASASEAESGPSSSSETDSSTSADATSSDATTADTGEIDPDIKAFGDSYEEFVNQYVDFMNRYANASSADQASMLTDYMSLLQQESDMVAKASELDGEKDTWNAATYQYWVELYARVTQKLLEAM